MHVGAAVSLLKKTYSKWSEHNAPRLGASVAFYTLLSFAPLLILTVAVIALVFDRHTAQAGLIDQARQMIGDRGADSVKLLLANAQKPSSGVLASIIALVTLLFGASGVFTELRDALNIIWDAEPKNESGLLAMVKQRLFSFGMVLSVGFLLLVSLILSAGLAVLGKFFSQLLPLPAFVFDVINFAVSFIVITILFALMFKFVPARQIGWRDVRVGAIGTALLFTIGKLLLGLYLGKASVGSSYGAAGSLVAMIVWVYYSAQIFFFGAEFTRVYADAHAGVGAQEQNARASQAGPREREQTENVAETSYTKVAAGGGVVESESSLPSSQAGNYFDARSKSNKIVHHKSGTSVLLSAITGLIFFRALRNKYHRSELNQPRQKNT